MNTHGRPQCWLLTVTSRSQPVEETNDTNWTLINQTRTNNFSDVTIRQVSHVKFCGNQRSTIFNRWMNPVTKSQLSLTQLHYYCPNIVSRLIGQPQPESGRPWKCSYYMYESKHKTAITKMNMKKCLNLAFHSIFPKIVLAKFRRGSWTLNSCTSRHRRRRQTSPPVPPPDDLHQTTSFKRQ